MDNEVLEQELKIKGNLRAFIMGCITGLAAGLIICGYIKEGAFIGLVAGFIGYISKPNYQRIRNA